MGFPATDSSNAEPNGCSKLIMPLPEFACFGRELAACKILPRATIFFTLKTVLLRRRRGYDQGSGNCREHNGSE